MRMSLTTNHPYVFKKKKKKRGRRGEESHDQHVNDSDDRGGRTVASY